MCILLHWPDQTTSQQSKNEGYYTILGNDDEIGDKEYTKEGNTITLAFLVLIKELKQLGITQGEGHCRCFLFS